MIQRLLLFLLFTAIIPPEGKAQTLPLSYELSINNGAGWWIHNHGSDDETVFNTLGWSRTHFAHILQAQGTVEYHLKKGTIGIGSTYSWLFDNEMINPRDRVGLRDRTAIADTEWMPYWQVFIVGNYALIQKSNFTFRPQLRLGTFDLQTTYPPATNFGFRYFWSVGLTFEFPFLKQSHLFFRPYYALMTIHPKTPNFNEIHRIYDLGIGIGIILNRGRTH